MRPLLRSPNNTFENEMILGNGEQWVSAHSYKERENTLVLLVVKPSTAAEPINKRAPP